MMRQSFVTPAEAGVQRSAARAKLKAGSRPEFILGPRKARTRGPGRQWRAAALVIILLGLGLAGCGKKNQPQPPPGVPNTYPRPYPSV
jgi:hypothetical protein